MELSAFFPILGKLDNAQKELLTASARPARYPRGTVIHTSGDCMGPVLVQSGQLHAYTVSENGREITLYRLFERDICLFSAFCMMRSLQVDITIAAEKDTEVLVIPTDVYKQIQETSAPLANYTNELLADRFSDIILSFAADVMLSAAVLGLILPSLEYGGTYGILWTVLGIFAGVLCLNLIDRLVPHLHKQSTDQNTDEQGGIDLLCEQGKRQDKGDEQ